MDTNLSKPGVYIDQVNAFPNPVVQVATAVPAFIGYTPSASHAGEALQMQPVRVTSFAEFSALFGNPAGAKPYSPTYYLNKVDKAPASGKSYEFNGEIYTIEPDPGTIYYLWNSVKLYFQNGGEVAYIVSLGPYGAANHAPINPGDDLINTNVKLADFQAALGVLQKVDAVTMYIVPESNLLSAAEYSTLIQSMLAQSSAMQTSLSIIDVKGGREPDPQAWPQDIANFRSWSGNYGLDYAAAYYPYLKTTAVAIDQVDYTNINGGDLAVLLELLSPAANPNRAAAAIINSIKNGNTLSVAQNNQALLLASKTYTQLLSIIQEQINTIPASGVVAGIISSVDAQQGVWVAPANVSPVGVTDLTIQLSDQDQQGLSVDALSGKSVNAFRFFNGQGVLLWGARTLDGNSEDWRYINVRRTVNMIRQSIKDALWAYVFAPNNANTWTSIKSMVESFLTSVWKDGALQGSTPADAFGVLIGLGSTMTAQDIFDGYLRVTALLAVTRPAEFIVITVEQQLPKS